MRAKVGTRGTWRGLAIGALALLAFAAGAASLLGQDAGRSSTPSEPTSVSLHPVHIRQPDGPPRMDVGRVDHRGQAVTVACSTCHAVREPDRSTSSTADLDEAHHGLAVAHGGQSCLSCHHPEDYDSLRLADGRRLPFTDVMTLCGQCHGTQLRDYRHGAHGGMTGYWDLTRGPRERNNCTDCHDPHAPAFTGMIPAPGPRDRFLGNDDPHGHEGEEAHDD